MNKKYKTYSVKGKDRNSNSDYILVKSLPEGWIGIVCDGVGDNVSTKNSGKICAGKIIELIENSTEPDPLVKLKSAIENTNEYLLLLKNKDSENNKLVTTLVVIYLLDHTVCWGHVGDSRMYQLKNSGLNLLTKDHSVIQELVDKGFLTLKEASLHTGTNIIGRAMGEKPNVNVDVSKINLQPLYSHRFLLCTDGLTNLLSDAEIENCLQEKELETCYKSFTSSIKSKYVSDDTAFLIVDPY